MQWGCVWHLSKAVRVFFFFFNDPATPEISPLSLHDALPIFCTTTLGLRGSVTSTAVKFFGADSCASHRMRRPPRASCMPMPSPMPPKPWSSWWERSEEHTSELQSLAYLVCRLLLEKTKSAQS